MFYNEARVGGLFRHANLISVHDALQIESRHTLVMEYVAGQTLEEFEDRLKKDGSRLPLDVALYVIAQAARGLAHSHEVRDLDGSRLDLVHRDISPQNIMVGHDGRVKVFDFGLAVAAAQSSESRELQGKTAYMSPEQVRGRALDSRSDLFSLGVVLFELVTGKRLFERENQMATIRAVTEDEIPKPSSLVEDLPENLDTVVLTALARGVDNRFQSGDDFADALELLLDELQSTTDQTSLGEMMQRLFRNEIGELEAVVQKILDAPEQSEATIDLSTFDVSQSRAMPAVPGPELTGNGIARSEGDGLERLTGPHGMVDNLPPVRTSDSVLPNEASSALIASVHNANKSKKLWQAVAVLAVLVALGAAAAMLAVSTRTAEVEEGSAGQVDRAVPAFVLVTSDPPGGRVLVGGEDTSRTTPTQVQVIADRSVTIGVELEGFLSRSADVTATTTEPAIVELDLERDPDSELNRNGTLVVIFQPADASVYVDDTLVGSQSPVRIDGLELFTEHRLRIEKLGFESHSDAFRLDGPDVQTMQMQLVTAQEVGRVNVRSSPSGATVFINDEEVGTTPIEDLELVADQEYRIRIEQDGAVYRTRVILDPGSQQNIDGELRRPERRPTPVRPANPPEPAAAPTAAPTPEPEPEPAPAAPTYQLLE
jgi:serine/threonine protein kinase